MSNYSYVAVDPRGFETRGTLEVSDQTEALRRLKEMGLFPTKLLHGERGRVRTACVRQPPSVLRAARSLRLPGLGRRVKPRALCVFTRQLATLVEAGMPLLRGLRTLEEQAESPALKRVIGELSASIEGGSSLAEAIAAHPKVFSRLYVNMVRAGELGGALELTLRRLAEFMEKAQKIKGKVKAAMFYPFAVLAVAAGIVVLLMTFVVPRFKDVFQGLLEGAALPAFTRFVMGLSESLQHHILGIAAGLAAVCGLALLGLQTKWGRFACDHLKLALPILGPVFRKAAISRFARTLGTLTSSGVPILQALTVVKETAGNVAVERVIATLHDNVKAGDPLAPTLKASRVFPAMVAGMVDVGEETGALPDLLLKIADSCDEEVDNATTALTSLLEPVLIVFLAVVVGSIVIAMFLPIITVTNGPVMDSGTRPGSAE